MGCSKLSSKREVYSNSLLVQETRKISKRQYNVIPQRRQWQPTPVLLPGKSHGQRSLVGCSPWGHYDADMTERLHFHFSLSRIGEGNGNPLQYSFLENLRDWKAWWAAVYGVARVGHDWSDLAAVATAMLYLKQIEKEEQRKPKVNRKTKILKIRVDWMHETSARIWCTGKTQRDRVEREVGGGIGMGNTCKSMADSWQCMTKTTTIL